ncbi:MAG TPA: SDR family NAD(P)-dependent oxidoreductase [Candidatus Dormibacteraeota bacterium]|nr:SDR family NAD(P)-dependent oxidoreductase [Candidatus Dormibacteraeota bacterium]
MKVFVTGGAGFIGSHLCDALLERGDSVVAFDDLSTGNIKNLASALERGKCTFVEGDIRNSAAVSDALSGCDAIVHLAARIGLHIIIKSPLETLDVNARGTETILAAALERNLPVIIASTSEVYGYATKIPSNEEDPICFGSPTVGRWSYACAKAFDEFYALALHRERALSAVVVRLFNTVGPRQSGQYGMVVPRFVTQAVADQPLTVYGDGSQTRCFCYVGDVTKTLATILDRMGELSGEVFNLGNPREITIRDLAERVVRRVGSASVLKFVPFVDVYPTGFEEIARRVPDVEKAIRLTGFSPKTELDEVIDRVIDERRRIPSSR